MPAERADQPSAAAWLGSHLGSDLGSHLASHLGSRQGSRRTIAWLGALFLAAIVAQAGFEVWRGHARAVRGIETELDAQSRVIAEQTARAVQTVDVVLENLAEQLQRGMLARAGAPELHAYLQEKARGLVQSDGLVIFNADGSLRAISQLPTDRLPPLVFAHDAPFAAIRDRTQGELYLHGTVWNSTTRRWTIPIGRRLTDAEGRFAGVVGAVGRVEYFESFYRDSQPDPSTRISLVHRNASLMARHPPAEGMLGRRLEVVDALLPPGSPTTRAVTRLPSPVDGVDHFVALRTVPDYPLLVAVSRDAEAALAPWRTQALGTAARTLALVALAAGLLWATLRQLARLQAARQSLEVSEERYALAMTGSDEGHWLWNIAERQVYVSARLAALFGLSGDGARTIADEEYFASLPLHPEDRERVHHNRNEHVAGRTPRLDHEFRIVDRSSGEVRWMHTRAQCFRDAAGRPLRLAGSTVDVTPRKRAEEALRQSEARFADAVAGADTGIWEWDLSTGMAFGSRRGRQILGLPPEPELRTIEQWRAEVAPRVHPDDAPRREAALQDHLAGRVPIYDCDFRALQADGSYRWVHVHGRCVRDAEGRVLRIAGSAMDIDDRKRTEEALRESEERYLLAMTGSRGGHWVWEVATDRLFGSPAMNELFGLPTDWQPRTRSEYSARMQLHPADVEHFTASMRSLIDGSAARADYEFRIVLPDGALRWVLTRAQRFEAVDARGVRIAGVSVDITERKQAEAERERLAQQLRQAQKLEAIGTLAGGIAHDFNNILSAILGYGELVQRETAEGSAPRRHIDAAMSAGQRAKSLVERILAFSRSGLAERVPVHAQSVLDEALDAAAAALPPGVRLVRDIEVGDAAVTGDATQLHQVVMNLTANAAQAMKGEGELVVRAEVRTLDAPLAVATSTLRPGSHLLIAVQDSGSGIAPEVLDRIFDPFFTTKEVGVGTGLGLSLVHGIVTDLGGGIDVKSEAGRGSTFTVWLPSRPFVQAPAVPEAPVVPGAGEVVLLVDDEEPLVRLGEEMLAELGYEPAGFASSAAALEAFVAEPGRFDLLLSDEAMPGMTGSELAAAVRALRPELPIVLMTGFATPALMQRARELGVAEVLGKPLARREIARALAAALAPAPPLPSETK